MKKMWIARWVLASMTSMVAVAHAQDNLPADSFAKVNGQLLSKELVEQVVRNNQAQGAQATPEARKLIETELAARAALSQEAVKLGLDKTPAFKAQLELLTQNLLAETWLASQLAKSPIDEAAIKADYERQVTLLKDSKEYKIRSIVVAEEAQAKAVVASLRKGESFEKLAREKSVDPSKANGGDLGWLLAEQITPAIANVVANLSKGGMTMSPIQVGNAWHVLKLDDTRPFAAPTYETAKPQIAQALLAKQRNEFISKVLSTARIQLGH